VHCPLTYRNIKVGLESYVIAELASSNLEQALSLLPKVRLGQTQLSAYLSVGSVLVLDKPDQALDLGSQLNEEFQNEYFAEVITRWFHHKPQSAIAAISHLSTATARSAASLSIIQSSHNTNQLSSTQLSLLESWLDKEDSQLIK
jgi:hypothetical protein